MAVWKEEDFVTGVLFLAVLCHGMFFAREWLIFGAVFILAELVWLFRKGHSCQRSGEVAPKTKFSISLVKNLAVRGYKGLLNPVGIFVLMMILSLTGLFQPVRRIEGWLEAFRWLVFFTAYLWGKHLGCSAEVREKVLENVLLVAFVSTVLTWLPGSETIWLSPGPPEEGRFASSFGYPNAAAVFLGCQLLLLQKDEKINPIFVVVFALSIISTGSRAAVTLLVFFTLVLILKKIALHFKNTNETVKNEELLGFHQSAGWTGCPESENPKRNRSVARTLILVGMMLLLQHTLLRCHGSLQHLLDWTDTSMTERMLYYRDSMKIAWYAHFLPQAGGWLAFPFVQNVAYWTFEPHSSFCRILLNQGLAGVMLLGIWSVKGIKGYLLDLIWGRDLTVICSKTAVLYLALHSLIDVDMSFGALGILFWLMIGLNSGTKPVTKSG